MSLNDIHSLSHTKWNCKYHIVFAPKYRRQVFYKEKREAIGKILRQLCEWKGEGIVEAELCPDHIHMLVSILPHMRVSEYQRFTIFLSLLYRWSDDIIIRGDGNGNREQGMDGSFL